MDNVNNGNNDNQVNNSNDEYSDDNQPAEKTCSSTWWWLFLVMIGVLMVALLVTTYMLWDCKRAPVESVPVNDYDFLLEKIARSDDAINSWKANSIYPPSISEWDVIDLQS
jgi:hypothetical protein